MNTFYDNLAVKLRNAVHPLPSVTAGFDGFVDEMISVVAERQTLTSFRSVPDIGTFGGLISKAAGHSSLREIVVTAVHPGGAPSIWGTAWLLWELLWMRSRHSARQFIPRLLPSCRDSVRHSLGGQILAEPWPSSFRMANSCLVLFPRFRISRRGTCVSC
ncbi:hypothetical protein SDC9_175581 [bioreactor metagenome]|uniref:Uncharacterized protein n=1 Tax=bioreactor metagenome TaxID=1076179 RepID=A0A645GQD8_9ZZZZ